MQFFSRMTICRWVGSTALEEGDETGDTSSQGTQALSQSSHHQAGSVPGAVLKEGILLVFICLEGNLAVRREIVPVAVPVTGNIAGEPGLSAELGDCSRLLRHA